jgi:hypothetical protein
VAENEVLGGNVWTQDYIRCRWSEKWVMKLVVFVLSIRYDLTHEMGWICRVCIALRSCICCKTQRFKRKWISKTGTAVIRLMTGGRGRCDELDVESSAHIKHGEYPD